MNLDQGKFSVNKKNPEKPQQGKPDKISRKIQPRRTRETLFLASAVDNVMQFIEKWDVNKDPRKFINHMILTGAKRTAFEQTLAAKDGGKWSE